MVEIILPTANRTTESYELSAGPKLEPIGSWNRTAYAAAHVVADPFADIDPYIETAIDWDKTLEYRSHLWELGFGVVEAMDTAQRGMGLDWPTSLELNEEPRRKQRGIK